VVVVVVVVPPSAGTVSPTPTIVPRANENADKRISIAMIVALFILDT